MKERIGLLGGTFDPPHLGHLAMAEAAREAAGLDRVLLVPSRNPYHKRQPVAGYEDRLAMGALLADCHPWLQVSDAERETVGPSYTVDLLARFGNRGFGPDQLHFVMGADSLLDLPRWKDPGRILSLARVIALSRPGFDVGAVRWGDLDQGRVILVSHLAVDLSSTGIREQLAAGRQPDGLPGAVFAYVREKGLYGSGARGPDVPRRGVAPCER